MLPLITPVTITMIPDPPLSDQECVDIVHLGFEHMGRLLEDASKNALIEHNLRTSRADLFKAESGYRQATSAIPRKVDHE